MTAPSSPQFNFQLPSSVDSTATSAGSTRLGNQLGNAVKATTGVTDFKQAGQDFSRGGISGIAGGIGHSIMGGLNAASTAAMAVPGVGEGVKAADIGLNSAVKGADMFKAADAAKASRLPVSQFGPDVSFMKAADVKKNFVNPDRLPGQFTSKSSYAAKLDAAKSNGLYNQIQSEGIKNPIVLQQPGAQRFSFITKPQIFDGTHRLSVANDIDPNSMVPVKYQK